MFLLLNSKETVKSVSPKFIVTLDGVPSQLGNLLDCEMELDDVKPRPNVTDVPLHMKREPDVGIQHRLLAGATSPEGEVILFWNCLSPFLYSSDQKYLVFLCNSYDFCVPSFYADDMMEAGVMDDVVPVKKQKVPERCKFWPVCKSGDECLYHHPTTQCKWELYFSLFTLHQSFWKWMWLCFPFSQGPSPTVNLGINAFLSIQIVNTMPGAPNQTVPLLMSAAEAQLLFPPGQVSSYGTCGAAQAAQTTHCMHQCISNSNLCIRSGAASEGCKRVSLLPRMQECRLSVLSPKGKKQIDLIVCC